MSVSVPVLHPGGPDRREPVSAVETTAGSQDEPPTTAKTDALWPRYLTPHDIHDIEAIPLHQRGLPDSTHAALARAAALWPERPAVTVLPSAAEWEQGETLSFAEVLGHVDRYARLLRALGVSRQTAVGLMSPNTAELIAAILAAQSVGIAAPVNPDLSLDHLTQLFRRGGVRVLIVAGPELAPAVWEAGRAIAEEMQLDALLALRPTAATGPPPTLEPVDGVRTGYLEQLATEHDGNPTPRTGPRSDDIAAFFHTGGTTGTPKLAAHLHGNEIADAWMIAAYDLLSEESVIFAALPLFHVNALIVTVLAPLLRGQHVVWAGPLGYREPALFQLFWKLVEHFRLSAMSAVPTVYASLADTPVDADISSLRLALVGASPLPPAVRAAFEGRTKVALAEGYGLTEATCATARTFPTDPRPGSVGQRMPYQQVKAIRIDDDGGWHDLDPGELGTLVIKGPTVFPGYVLDTSPAAAPQLGSLGKLVDGWLDTGDLASVDADGFIYLQGRDKDLIIRGGHNIDPVVIEDVLLGHPDATAANAVGRPDPRAGEVPVVYVTVRDGSTVEPQSLRDWAAAHISERAAAPKEVIVVQSLPVTAVGKPYKVALRADAAVRAVRSTVAADTGINLAEGQVRCDATSGALEVVIDPPPGARIAVATVMDRFSLRWHFAPDESDQTATDPERRNR